jgi:hypothetical protein
MIFSDNQEKRTEIEIIILLKKSRPERILIDGFVSNGLNYRRPNVLLRWEKVEGIDIHTVR